LSELNPNEVLQKLHQNSRTTIKMTENEFYELLPLINDTLGDSRGIAYIVGRHANVFFNKAENVNVIITTKKRVNMERIKTTRLDILGSRKSQSFTKFMMEEVRLYWLHLLIIFVTIGPFLLIQGNPEFIKEINTVIISAMAILIGVFLVFITFFYLGAEHKLAYFETGRYFEHLNNDRHIVQISIITVLFSILSIGLSYYKYDIHLFDIIKVNLPFLYFHVKILGLDFQNQASGVTTLISIFLFWITFKAMTEYYFDRINNQISKDVLFKIHSKYFK
jgi:hypothetical protein